MPFKYVRVLVLVHTYSKRPKTYILKQASTWDAQAREQREEFFPVVEPRSSQGGKGWHSH